MPKQAYKKKNRLYLISLGNLLDLPLYFDLTFKYLWESCGMKSFHFSKNWYSFNVYKNDFMILSIQKNYVFLFFILLKYN